MTHQISSKETTSNVLRCKLLQRHTKLTCSPTSKSKFRKTCNELSVSHPVLIYAGGNHVDRSVIAAKPCRQTLTKRKTPRLHPSSPNAAVSKFQYSRLQPSTPPPYSDNSFRKLRRTTFQISQGALGERSAEILFALWRRSNMWGVGKAMVAAQRA